MAYITSGSDSWAVIVLVEGEMDALQYLLERVVLEGTSTDEMILSMAHELLNALDVEVVV